MSVSIYKRKDSKYYWVSYYHENRRINKSLKTNNIRIARLKTKLIEEELVLGKIRHIKKDDLIKDFFDRYQIEIQTNKSHKTKESDDRAMNLFKEYLGDRWLILPINSVARHLIDKFRNWLKVEKKLSNVSINLYFRHLRSIFTNAENWEMVEKNPFKGIKQLKIEEKPPKFLTQKQVDLLLTAAMNLHDKIYIAIALGIYAGMRKSEIANARWEWFDFEHSIITLKNSNTFHLKSRRSRTIPLNNKLAHILSPYRREEGFIFNHSDQDRKVEYWYDFRNPMKKVCHEVDLDWVTPHILRHTFASLLALQGVSIYKIKEWLGHSDIRVTAIYSHLQAYDEDINQIK